MKNTVELQLRALRSPRVLKKTDQGDPELIDVWAIHRSDRTPNQFAIAIKFGREIIDQAAEIKTGTLFKITGRLDQSRNPATGIYHTFVWAESVSDIVQSTKNPSALPAPEVREAGDDEHPELELPHA